MRTPVLDRSLYGEQSPGDFRRGSDGILTSVSAKVSTLRTWERI